MTTRKNWTPWRPSEQGGKAVHADSVYHVEEAESELAQRGIESQVHERAYRNQALNKKQATTTPAHGGMPLSLALFIKAKQACYACPLCAAKKLAFIWRRPEIISRKSGSLNFLPDDERLDIKDEGLQIYVSSCTLWCTYGQKTNSNPFPLVGQTFAL